jgi:hypothetical protein
MDYDKAITEYLKLRTKIEKIQEKAKLEAAEYRKQMLMLENWMTLKANKEGLKNITTPHGTGYWSVHKRASVANPEEFLNYVIGSQRWDLMEKRASKIAVAQEVEDTGSPPPGINFSTIKVFNVKRDHSKDDAA